MNLKPDSNRKPTIFLLEDEPQVARYYFSILANEGYSVNIAASGDEAWRIISETQQHYDLMLIDYLLPGMNGLEFVKKMRDELPHYEFRFAVFTNYFSREVKKEFYDLGAIDYVEKIRLDIPEIKARIASYFSDKFYPQLIEKNPESNRQKTILYIEDEPRIREIYLDELALADYQIFGAANIQEGWELIRKLGDQLDLLLLDYLLPDKSGLEFLKELRQHPDFSNTAVVILTNFFSKAIEVPFTMLGVLDCIEKASLDLQELRIKVKHYLEVAEQNQKNPQYIWSLQLPLKL